MTSPLTFVPGHGGVAVVRELVESVNDGELRVGGGQQSQGQWHRAPDHGLPIVQL